MSHRDDQAAGLRQLFRVELKRIGLIDCLVPPLNLETLLACARLRKFEFVSARQGHAEMFVMLFEASVPGVLTAYARLKEFVAETPPACPLYAWSQASAGPQQTLAQNLVGAARQFLGLGIEYQGAVELSGPEAIVMLADRIAALAACDDPRVERCAPEAC